MHFALSNVEIVHCSPRTSPGFPRSFLSSLQPFYTIWNMLSIQDQKQQQKLQISGDPQIPEDISRGPN
ncbi:hypothetical protein ACN38_g5988 [Penicillium nordicum]|uniref:Uncharacterized protein n=1 Tax=Penicillium nordicum TaxID=229535 RepID=A0A0M8P8V1_9EURO|nr:hypothetical protein ACN38_g5988 [Penicillium nordicum]